MSEPRDDRFIAGIYNYCDRWCERCRFTASCRVFDTEQKRLERHLLRGEDPEDPQVWVQDMEESFGETIRMLEQMADEQGVDLSAEMPDAPEPSPRDEPDWSHPLVVRLERWSERVGALLERVRTEMPEIGEDLARRGERFSECEQKEVVRTLEGLRDAYELLMQYRLFVIVKTIRATGSLAEAESEKNAEIAGYARGDAMGTAKLVHECLGKAAAALWCVAEFRQEWQDEALPLAAETEAIRQAIDAAFPDHQSFHRPGLDDPSLS